jgi:hypothetical protein
MMGQLSSPVLRGGRCGDVCSLTRHLSSTVLKTSGGGDKPAEFNPVRHALYSQNFFMGFQTGDLVKANVLTGKYAGIYTGRIAIRFNPSFKLTTGGKSFTG